MPWVVRGLCELQRGGSRAQPSAGQQKHGAVSTGSWGVQRLAILTVPSTCRLQRGQHSPSILTERRRRAGPSTHTAPGIPGASQGWGHWDTLPPSPGMAETSSDRSYIIIERESSSILMEKINLISSLGWSSQPAVVGILPQCPGWGPTPSQHTVFPNPTPCSFPSSSPSLPTS